MSITEMKVQAFEKLASLNEESAIKEILVHLETLTASKPTFDADKFLKNLLKSMMMFTQISSIMITKEIVLRLHELSILNYCGSAGIRDEGLMESAIARPYQTFGGEYLYKTVFEQAAAIAESIIINHPFVDGNKRTGFLAMLAVIEHENYVINTTNDEVYNFTIKISTGELKFEEIVEWLKLNTIKA